MPEAELVLVVDGLAQEMVSPSSESEHPALNGEHYIHVCRHYSRRDRHVA